MKNVNKYERFFIQNPMRKPFATKLTEEEYEKEFTETCEHDILGQKFCELEKETKFIEPIEESMSPREYLDCLMKIRDYLEIGKEEEIKKIQETFNIYAEPIEIKIRNLEKILRQ